MITTIVSDNKAKRTTIDNFDENQDYIPANSSDFFNEDDGFVIVNRAVAEKSPDTTNINKNKFTVDFGKDTNSSFNIITHADTQTAETIAKSNTTTENQIEQTHNENKNIETNNKAENDLFAGNIFETTPNNDDASLPTDEINPDIKEINPPQNANNEQSQPIPKQNITQPANAFVEQKNNYQQTETTTSHTNIALHSNFETNTLPDDKNIDKQQDGCIKHSGDLPVSLIADLERHLDSSIDEFAYLISRFLMIMRVVIDAKTVGFIWVNHELKTLLFDSYLSDNEVKDSIIKDKKIKFGNDIVSQIATNSKPQILTQINPAAELDLIPYYTKPVGTGSFIGIPIIFENTVVGVLCADTNSKDAYDRATVAFMGHFTKVLSALFGSFSNKYSNENANKTLELINKFSEIAAKRNCTFNDICSAIIDFVTDMYNCSSIGVVAYNDNLLHWTVCSYKSIENVDDNFFKEPVLLDSSLIGICISNCRIISLTNVPMNYVRVNQQEPTLPKGAFIAIPIKSTTDSYGALFVEAKDDEQFTNNVELEILKAICNQAGEILEKIKLVGLFSEYVAIETKTGIFTDKAFHNRINEEFLRANDTKHTVSLALLGLDKYSSIEEISKKSRLLDHIINIITKQLKPFEILGRVNSDVLGIILIGRDANQAKLLLERVRQQVATQFVDYGKEKLVITISVGIATSKPNDTFDSFTSNATIALRHAQKRSNYIQTFE